MITRNHSCAFYSFLLAASATLFLTTSAFADRLWTPANGARVHRSYTIDHEFVCTSSLTGDEALVIWRDDRDGDLGLFGQLINADTTMLWSPDGVRLAQAYGEQLPAGVVAVPDGWVFVWLDARNSPSLIGNFEVFAQKVTSDGTLRWREDGRHRLKGILIARPQQAVEYANVVVGEDGSVFVSWQTRTQLRLTHLMPDGSVDPSWPEEGLVVAARQNATFHKPHCLEPDGFGGVIVAWNEFWLTLGVNRLAAERFDASGRRLWSDSRGGLLTSVEGDLRRLSVSADRLGGLFAAFTSGDYDHPRIQRISPEGVRLWGDDGEPITTPNYGDVSSLLIQTIIPDTAVVVWDFPGGRAQKISGTASCTRFWHDPNGTIAEGLTISDDDVYWYDVLPDNAAGAILLFDESIGFNGGPMVQHVSGDGVLQLGPTEGRLYANSSNGYHFRGTLMQNNQAYLFGFTYTNSGTDYGRISLFDYDTSQHELLTSHSGIAVTRESTGPVTYGMSLYQQNTLYSLYTFEKPFSQDTTRLQAMNPDTGERLFGDQGIRVFEPASTNETYHDKLKLAAGADGTVIAASITFNDFMRKVLRLDKLSPQGEHLWGPEGISFATDPEGENMHDLELLPTDDGGVCVVFEYGDNDNSIGAQRFDPNGQPMWTDGTLPYLPIVYSFDNVYSLDAIRLPDGSYIVCWDTTENRWYINLQRFDSDGELLWDDPISFTGEAPSVILSDVHLLAVEQGVLVTWLAHLNDQGELRGCLIGFDGSLLWGPDPVQLVTGDNWSYNHCTGIASADAGSFWLAWDNTLEQLLVQRFSITDGSPVLDPPGGVVLASAESIRVSRDILVASDNSLLLAAYVRNGETSDLFYTRVLDDGSPAPGYETPQVLCSAPADQMTPYLIDDQAGGAFAVWVDRRGSTGDNYDDFGVEKLYAQRIGEHALSAVVASERTPAISWELHPIHPNPFNDATTVTVELPHAGYLRVGVWDILGRRVTDVYHGFTAAGPHQFTLDATLLASGVYFIRANFEDSDSQVRKIVLLK